MLYEHKNTQPFLRLDSLGCAFVEEIIKDCNSTETTKFSVVFNGKNKSIEVYNADPDDFIGIYNLGKFFALHFRGYPVENAKFEDIFHSFDEEIKKFDKIPILTSGATGFLKALKVVNSKMNIKIEWTELHSGDGLSTAGIKSDKCTCFSIFYLGFLTWSIKK